MIADNNIKIGPENNAIQATNAKGFISLLKGFTITCPRAQIAEPNIVNPIPIIFPSKFGELTAEAFDGTADSQEDVIKRLQFVLWRLEAQQDWERGALFTALKGLAEALELKPKVLFAPLFVAVSGKSSAYSIPDSMSILGPDLTRARLRNAISVLGGVSKKAAKRLEKEYAALA